MMAKIRKDVVGVVHAGGIVLRAGDTIPDGVRVGGHLTDTGKAVGPAGEVKPVQNAADASSGRDVDPLNEDELEAAALIDLPVEGVDPERVRGAIIGHGEGYRAGWDAAVAAADAGTVEGVAPEGAPEVDSAFDPSEHNAPAVHEYLEENPEDTERVLGLERAGKGRSGILDKYDA